MKGLKFCTAMLVYHFLGRWVRPAVNIDVDTRNRADCKPHTATLSRGEEDLMKIKHFFAVFRSINVIKGYYLYRNLNIQK